MSYEKTQTLLELLLLGFLFSDLYLRNVVMNVHQLKQFEILNQAENDPIEKRKVQFPVVSFPYIILFNMRIGHKQMYINYHMF